MTDSTWLPNLVGGTSMWRLASDLNEPKFFDGRLLIPETEGSESLPVTVRWDLTGLIPLAEARTKHPEESATAIKEFQTALERVAKVFATPNSGFDKYKEAFTVPSLEADNGANYFYSPAKKKIFVTNWGASPRSMGGKAEYVFGFEDWAKQWADPAVVAGAAVTAGAAAAAVAKAPDAPKPDEAKKEDDKKNAEAEKKKDEKKGRPWWFWPLFGLIAIALILLALFLLKACEDQHAREIAEAGAGLPDGAVLLQDGAVLLADGAVVSLDAALAMEDSGADAAAADGGDGGDASALGDGGDSGSLADGGDAGKKKHKDGGADAGDDDDDDDDDGTIITGSSGGGPGGTVIVKTFPGSPGGGARTSVHRKHYSDEATHWRVTGATNKISRTEDSGHRFDVWLNPGQTFEGVKVEWQDKNGKWHVH